MIYRTLLACTLAVWLFSEPCPAYADGTLSPNGHEGLPSGRDLMRDPYLEHEVADFLEEDPPSSAAAAKADSDLLSMYPAANHPMVQSAPVTPKGPGTKLELRGNQSMRLSEASAQRLLGPGTLSFGLIDSTATLGRSEVVNYSTTRFKSKQLLSNPTSPFPSSALGLLYRQNSSSDQTGLNLMASSTSALRSNTAQGLTSAIDVFDEAQGAFLAAETFSQPDDFSWRLGTWMNTADHSTFDGASDTANNFGAYWIMDADLGLARWSSRVGAANPDVSVASWNASSAMTFDLSETTTGGLGYSHTWVSESLSAEAEDQRVAEAYLRKPLSKRTTLSPTLKYIENTSLGSLDGANDWVGNLGVTVTLY